MTLGEVSVARCNSPPDVFSHLCISEKLQPVATPKFIILHSSLNFLQVLLDKVKVRMYNIEESVTLRSVSVGHCLWESAYCLAFGEALIEEVCMNKLPGVCPVCGHTLHVTRLKCSHCGTSIEGEFELPLLARLSREHQLFVITFLRAEGKLNKVQEVLGISYPTARARLLEVVKAMGFEVEAPAAGRPPKGRRMEILEDLAAGKISVDQAIEKIKSGG